MSIVVCTYDERRRGDLRECVTSLLEQIPFDSEILVVVDHNRALYDSLAAEYTDSAVKVILNDLQNEGQASSMNYGVRNSRGSIVCFLDDDAVPDMNWNTLVSSSSSSVPPNIVIAIQKEMFRDRFFFFVARMSRGIFRRFLRYITLTLQHWETDKKGPVDWAIVNEAVTVERLAEDMALELGELFPKQRDLRPQAVRLLMHREESGPRKQTELAEELGMEGYAMSRLLTKLEIHRHVVRRREGTDKLVSLLKT